MKSLSLVIALSCCCLHAHANDYDNGIYSTEYSGDSATLSYGFEEKLDNMGESVEMLKQNVESLLAAYNKTHEELRQLKQAMEQQTKQIADTTSSVAAKTNLNILNVKCPEDRLPKSCSEVADCKTDIYSIMIPEYSEKSQAVTCDLTTDNGRWTVIQRRQDGSVNFYRNWTEYVEGFGNADGEFFIGLEKLHHLTSGKKQELYILLQDFEGKQRYAKYTTFKIDSKENDYQLTVDKYTGDAGDSLKYHNGQKFSTWDRDTSNCAKHYKGAWWHKSCHESNLNGLYLMGKLPKSKSGLGMSWSSFRGSDYALKMVKMMIRPHEDDE